MLLNHSFLGLNTASIADDCSNETPYFSDKKLAVLLAPIYQSFAFALNSSLRESNIASKFSTMPSIVDW